MRCLEGSISLARVVNCICQIFGLQWLVYVEDKLAVGNTNTPSAKTVILRYLGYLLRYQNVL